MSESPFSPRGEGGPKGRMRGVLLLTNQLSLFGTCWKRYGYSES